MSSSSSKRKRDVIPERIKRLAIRRKTPATLPHNPNPSTSGPGIGTSTSTTGTRPADEANLQRSRNLWTTALQSLHPDERTIFDQVGVGAAEPDIISHLLSAAKAKEEECATHQWKFKLFGREIILRDLVAKVVEYIEKFQSIGDAIVNFDPVHCALPWAAVKLLLQTVVSEKEQHCLLLTGLERVSYLLCRCYVYEALYLQGSPSVTISQANTNLQASLISMYVELLKFIAKALRIFHRGSFNQLITSWFTVREFDAQLQQFSTLEKTVAFEAANSSSILLVDGQRRLGKVLDDLEKPLNSLDSKLSYVQDSEDRKRRVDILQWISDIPYEDLHNSMRDGRTDGTGQWLFQEEAYLKWSTCTSSSVLWLFGSPGTGKTKLVTTVVDHFLNNTSSSDKNLVYFYCDRNQAYRRNPAHLLSSFVRQLSSSSPDTPLPASIMKIYEEREKKGFASNKLRLEESLSLFSQLAATRSKLTIIIDALDECELESRISLVDMFIKDIAKVCPSIKILISSRPDRDIKDYFQSGLNLEINVSRNFDDITRFIQDQLQKTPSKWQGQVDDILTDRIYQTLTNQCQGMFQWAVLQIRQLFKLSLRRDIIDRLGKLPRDLDAAYDEIHKGVQQQAGSMAIIADLAFHWLMCCQQPLSARRLTAAVCQDPSANVVGGVDVGVEHVLEACSNLLVYSKELGQFNFAHLSVREYLEARSDRFNHSHALVGKVCLTVLLDPVYQVIDQDLLPTSDLESWYEQKLKIPERFKVEDDVVVVRLSRLEWLSAAQAKGGSGHLNRIWPLVRYARHYWAAHLRQDGGSATAISLMTQKALKEFMGSSFEYWLRYFAYRAQHEKEHNPTDPSWRPMWRITEEFPHLQSIFRGWRAYNWKELFSRYIGKSLLYICWAGIDQVTREQWSNWELDLTLRDMQGNTLLETITMTSSLVMAQHIWENRRHQFALDEDYYLSEQLAIACCSKQTRMVDFLLCIGADPNSHSNGLERRLPPGTTLPLQIAAWSGSSTVLNLLVQHGAMFTNSRGEDIGSLYYAVYSRNVETVRVLLSHSVNVDHLVEDGWANKYGYALHAAAGLGAREILTLLLDYGANINIYGGQREYALHAAMDASDGLKTMDFLLSRGANVNAVSPNLGCALHNAAYRGRLEAARLLLRHGADINIYAGNFVSPLHAALRGSDREISEVRDDYLADADRGDMSYEYLLDEINYLDETASWRATAVRMSIDIMVLLLSHGADINSKDTEFGTCLHEAKARASGERRTKAIKFLLRHGAIDKPPLNNLQESSANSGEENSTNSEEENSTSSEEESSTSSDEESSINSDEGGSINNDE